MSLSQIYEEITKFGKLTENHVENLKARGFSDKTIEENRFFSGGKYLLEIENDMISKFTEKDLLKSGTFQKSGKSLQMTSVLLDERIVIPYINQKDEVTLLRPHKLGLPNIPVQIYQERNVTDAHLIITEGEFKAAAAVQMGYACVALPGVASFSGKHFQNLAKFLDKHKIQEVSIMFDNEVKDDPAFPNYKEKPIDRWDTQFYAYIMAREIEKCGIGARVAPLPDSWRQKGKIDIDGALAAGRSREDFDRLISVGRTWKSYVDELPDEAQDIIKRKTKIRHARSYIKKEWGKYVAVRWKGGEPQDDIISNFIIKIVATHQTLEGIIRSVYFINEFGEKSSVFPIDPSDMARADSFSTFCLSKGNFIWRGTTPDLKQIWETEFLEDDGRVIYESDHVGWLKDEKMWIFQNLAITEEGDEIRPDRSNIFWRDRRGIKPMAIDSGNKSGGMNVPALNTNEFDAHMLRAQLADSIGYKEACLCLGWCFAVFFMEEAFDMAGCFPFLFLAGKTSSGKSHVASWLMRIFGVETEGIQAEQTTAVGLQRYLAYYSSLPVFVDEYRNNDKVTNKNGLIRNAYNRQMAVKGIKSDFGIRQAAVRGTMIITGQEGPRDNAIMTRCINIIVSATRRNPENNPFDWFIENRDKFSRIGLDILRNKPEKLKIFKQIFDECRTGFNKDLKIDSRKSINYAIVAAGYATIFGDDKEFGKILAEEIKRIDWEINQEEESLVFWDDLLALSHSGKIHGEFWKHESGYGHFYFEGLYRIWSEDYVKRNREAPFTAHAIRNILKNEPYFVDDKDDLGKQKRRWIGNTRVRCLTFDMEKAPEAVQALIDYNQGVKGMD